MFKSLLRTDSNMGSIFLRLALGVVMFPHGAQKVLGWYGGPGFEKTLAIFTANMHFPAGAVILLMTAEFAGSLCLIAGLFTRVFALAIGLSLSICAAMNHVQNGFFMNWFGNQKGEGFEFHILAAGIALALVVKGGGAFSIDRMIAKK
ncbi:MAG: DoxX family protein [Nitrospirae bacterium]|nr:DoxX family protein [Nitrospirota bacterium]